MEESISEVVDTLTAQEQEVQDSEGRWYSVRIRPYQTSDHKIEGVVVAVVDVQDVKRRQAVEEAARTYAENIVNTVREPLLVLDERLRVVSANKSFLRAFQVSPEETKGTYLYDPGNGQWNIPVLRERLEEIFPKQTKFENFQVQHEFSDLGRRTLLLNARQIEPEAGGEKLILVVIEDVTDRA